MTSTPHPLPQWPEPIDGKITRPTAADGDEQGLVQFLDLNGNWDTCSWESAANDRDLWLHTRSWRPRVTAAQAAEALDLLFAPGFQATSARLEAKDVIAAFIAAHPDPEQ